MSIVKDVAQALGHGSEVTRAQVTGLDAEARLLVRRPEDAQDVEWRCDVLVTGFERPEFEPGDEVLVILRRTADSDGIVLGRVGRAALAPEAHTASPPATRTGGEHAPEKRVVIEADEELILRVGESSIRISRDGKVVIRGEHVLTRAKGTNRIKGGSVAIN